MACESDSGTIPFPSTNLQFQNKILTFQNHCLSSLYSFIPVGAWIIDSGATSHVCSDLTLFKDFKPAIDQTVSLPNGVRVPIAHTGTIHLTSALILYNVLHIPSFHFNLISVSSLVKTSSCSAHFYSDSYVIQDLTQGLMFGKCSILQNLYVLTQADLHASVVSDHFVASITADGHLWHQRLGHPSASKLQILSEKLSISKSSLHSSSHCNVCPLEKQK